MISVWPGKETEKLAKFLFVLHKIFLTNGICRKAMQKWSLPRVWAIHIQQRNITKLSFQYIAFNEIFFFESPLARK